MGKFGIIISGGIGNASITLETVSCLISRNINPTIFLLSEVNYTIYKSLLPNTELVLIDQRLFPFKVFILYKKILNHKIEVLFFNHATESRILFLLAYILGIKKKIGLIRYNNLFARLLLNIKMHFDVNKSIYMQELELIEFYLNLKIGYYKYSNNILKKNDNNICSTAQHKFSNYIVIAPGSSRELMPGRAKVTKKWPIEFYNELLCSLIVNGKNIILIFGPDDIQEYVFFKTLNNNQVKLMANSPILKVMEIIKKASLFIGNDSGLFHLADLLNVPHFVIFGPSNYNSYGPININGNIIRKHNLDCSPCNYMINSCPFQTECLYNLAPSEVIGQISKFYHIN